MPTGYEVEMYQNVKVLAGEAQKQTAALESIAVSLEKIANPPMMVRSSEAAPVVEHTTSFTPGMCHVPYSGQRVLIACPEHADLPPFTLTTRHQSVLPTGVFNALATLTKIANLDYRGPEPEAIALAQRALAALKEADRG